jgi:uncharacterized protein YuzE
MMSTTYDPDADAMFVRFSAYSAKSARTEEVSPGVMLDFDEAGRLLGIEILDVRERMVDQSQAA